jgi:hypothetical protein
VPAFRAFVCNRGRSCASRFLDLHAREAYDRRIKGQPASVEPRKGRSLLQRVEPSDKKNTMKRIIFITSAAVLAFAAVAAAQSSSTKPLADVAKTEEARRQQTKKPAKVITNSDLKPDISKGVPPQPTVTGVDASANASPGNTSPDKPASAPGPAKDQAYWAGRIKTARDLLTRQQLFADSLQTRINSLTTDFVNRDDPAQRAKIETDRKTALAELEKVKKEMADTTKQIAAIEEEARRAGVPLGWLRPGA